MNNSKGFSFIELVVALGITGITSLLFVNLLSNQEKLKSYSESKAEEETIAKVARLNLLKSSQCNDNLVGVTVPSDLTSINNANGTQVLALGDTFGSASSEVTLSRLSLSTLDGATPVEGDALIFFNIQTTRAQRNSSAITLNKSFLMRVELDSSLRITRCNTAIANVSGSLAENYCNSSSGIWSTGSATCTYTCPTAGTGSTNQILTAACLDEREQNTLSGANGDYIKLAGDTVSGRLQLPGTTFSVGAQMSASSQICINGNCRNFASQSCSTNRYGRGVLADGTFICDGPLDCGAGRYFQGFDSLGNTICQAVPLATCTSTDFFIREIFADGTVACEEVNSPTPMVVANTGNYIRSISASGTPTYRADRNLTPTTCFGEQFVQSATGGSVNCAELEDTSIFGKICGEGEAMTGIDAAGELICEMIQCTPQWMPETNTVCSGTTFTQSDGCGNTRSVDGTQSSGCSGQAPQWCLISTSIQDDSGVIDPAPTLPCTIGQEYLREERQAVQEFQCLTTCP